MKIYLATDHAGYELKETLQGFLLELGHEVTDLGACEYDKEDDYPDFIRKAAESIVKDIELEKDSRAIILGGSGQGEAMCANRFLGVRAVVYYGGDKEIVTLSREHNDANVLSLGARFLTDEEAKEAVRLWLQTGFSGVPKYQRRIEKMD